MITAIILSLLLCLFAAFYEEKTEDTPKEKKGFAVRIVAGLLAVVLFLGSLFVFVKGTVEIDRVSKSDGNEYVASQVEMFVVPFAFPVINIE